MRPAEPYPIESSPEEQAGIFDREELLAFFTLGFLGAVLVPATVVAVLLLLHVSSPWLFAMGGLAAALVGLYAIYLRPLRAAPQAAALAIYFGTLGVAILIAGLVYDVGWDAMTYHSEAILGMLQGVNPVYGKFEGNFGTFTNHYPKTIWYFAAATGGALHWAEAGKAYGLLLVISCAIYAWRFLRRLRLDASTSLVLALALALSPIAASQILSFYVDGALASLVTLLVLAILRHLDRPLLLDRAVLVLAAAAACTTKFTGAAYVCVALLLLALTLLTTPVGRSRVRPLIISFGLVMLLVLVLGYNPYITNVREGHSPGYPAVGRDKVAVISGDTQGPAEYFLPHRNRVENLISSLFSVTSQAQGAESAPIKIPFTVRVSEIKVSANPDMRTGGWGVLFSGILVASFALYSYARGWRWNPWVVGFGIVLVLATTLTNPFTYWARLVPQIGIIPIFLLLPCFASTTQFVRRLAMVIAALFLLNSSLLAAMGLQSEVRGTLRARRSMREIAQRCGPGDYTFDAGKTLIRYDLMPPAYGVHLHALPSGTHGSEAGMDLPIELIGGRQDTLHARHCALADKP